MPYCIPHSISYNSEVSARFYLQVSLIEYISYISALHKLSENASTSKIRNVRKLLPDMSLWRQRHGEGSQNKIEYIFDICALHKLCWNLVCANLILVP